MATAFSVSPILRLRRSTQSSNYTMLAAAAWQTVYLNTKAYAWMLLSGKIHLVNMVAGDAIDIRVSTRHLVGGNWIVEDLFDYLDAQPTNKQKITIGSIVDTFGVRVEMRQTAGALIICYCEFFEAVR